MNSIKEKHRKIAKRFPEYILSVVKVSSCSYQKTVLSLVSNWVVRIWNFVFRHNLSLSFVTVSVFEFCWYLSLSSFAIWVLSQFELNFVTIFWWKKFFGEICFGHFFVLFGDFFCIISVTTVTTVTAVTTIIDVTTMIVKYQMILL